MLEDLLKIKPAYSDVIELDTTNCSFDTSSLEYRFVGIDFTTGTPVTSWAIGDSEGNLFLACNEPLEGFNIIKTHIRPNIKAIGTGGYFNKIYEFNTTIPMSLNFFLRETRRCCLFIPYVNADYDGL